MKIKIRKVEVDVAEFINAVEGVIEVHEAMPKMYDYNGTSVTFIAKNLGIKEFDFWQLYTNNTKGFINRIVVKQLPQSDICVLYRTETWDEIQAEKKSREQPEEAYEV